MFTIGTTFSGIGAPEVALKKLGIQHSIKYACDISKTQKKIYLDNHKPDNFYDDITKIEIDKLDYVDCYVFGFPCQSYSSQGLRLGLEDNRGQLIYYSLEILRKKQPKFFVAENVKGLLSHNKGETFKLILSELESCGYKVSWKLLNTKDFGIPHNRPRVYIAGIRKDLDSSISLDFPKSEGDINDFLETNISSEFLMTEKHIQYCQNPKYKSDKVIINPKNISCLRSGAKSYYCFNGVYRFLTPVEMKRFQGFPDDFIISVSYNSIKFAFGNTMTVKILEEIFKRIS